MTDRQISNIHSYWAPVGTKKLALFDCLFALDSQNPPEGLYCILIIDLQVAIEIEISKTVKFKEMKVNPSSPLDLGVYKSHQQITTTTIQTIFKVRIIYYFFVVKRLGLGLGLRT